MVLLRGPSGEVYTTVQQSLISLLVGFHGQTPTEVLNQDERTVTDLSIPPPDRVSNPHDLVP